MRNFFYNDYIKEEYDPILDSVWIDVYRDYLGFIRLYRSSTIIKDIYDEKYINNKQKYLSKK